MSFFKPFTSYQMTCSHISPPSQLPSIAAMAPYQEDPSLVFDVSQLPPTKMCPAHLYDLLMSLEDVLKISDIKSSLSTVIRHQIHGLAVEDRNIIQMTVYVSTLTADQVITGMEVIPIHL